VPALPPLSLPDLGPLPDVSVLLSAYGTAAGMASNAVQAAAAAVSAAVGEVIGDIDVSISLPAPAVGPLLPADYKPPSYTSTTTTTAEAENGGHNADADADTEAEAVAGAMAASQLFRSNITALVTPPASPANASGAADPSLQEQVVVPVRSAGSSLLSSFTSRWAAFDPGMCCCAVALLYCSVYCYY